MTCLEAQLLTAQRATEEARECLSLTMGKLEAIRNAPPANEGTNICGHNRYWVSHYGRCMACERDQAEMREASALADLAQARSLLEKSKARLLFWKDLASRNGYGFQDTCGVVMQIDSFLLPPPTAQNGGAV